MLVSDQPIKDKIKDKLGHAYFSQALGRAINAYGEVKEEKNKDSIAIGLYGTWGSGKTSIINMTLEHIRELQKEKDEKEHHVIIRFSPWNYSNQNQLIAQFFGQLSIALEEHGLEDKAKEIVPLILKYATPFVRSAVSAATLNLVESVDALTQLYQKYNNTDKNHSPKIEDLDAIKCQLQELLSNISTKIIIVIDDIDRLNDVEIRQVFQLVKSLGDFHNTVYLLAFDRQTVVNALGEEQKRSGSKYLEKIVQIPLEVPRADKKKIFDILYDDIKTVIGGDIARTHKFNVKRWQDIYNDGLKYFFTNVRDIKRYINCLHLRVGLIADDERVDLIDLMAMTAFQVFLPELHSDIKNNEGLFARIPRNDIKGLNASESQTYDKIVTKAIYLIEERGLLIEEKQLKFLLGQLFPRLIYEGVKNE